MKQILREAQIREGLKPTMSAVALANLLLAWCQGRMNEFVRSDFQRSPLENWDIQWDYLKGNLLVPVDLNGAEPQSEVEY